MRGLRTLCYAILFGVLTFAPAHASQDTLASPVTGVVSGLALTQNYNAALKALASCNSGSSAPANLPDGPVAGQCWLDTSATPNAIKVYDGNLSWLLVGYLDSTNHIYQPVVGGGNLTVASATTTDLCGSGAESAALTISGTTSISSFGSSCPAGRLKFLRFSDILTLTHNGTSLILPNNGRDIATAAGASAIAMSLGSGNWQVVTYTAPDGQAVNNPAVAVCSVIDYSGFAAPDKYDFPYGQTFIRANYPDLLACLTITQTATRTSGSPTITGLTDTSQIRVAVAIEGSGFASGTTVVSCTSTACTLSNNASSSGSSSVQFFPYGNGNGSTTANLPDYRGRVLAGRDNMGGTAASVLTNAGSGCGGQLGEGCGAQSKTLATANLPAYTPSGSIVSVGTIGGAPTNILIATGSLGISTSDGDGSVHSVVNSNVVTTTSPTLAFTGSASFTGSAQGGSSTPFATLQPTRIVNKIIRVLP